MASKGQASLKFTIQNCQEEKENGKPKSFTVKLGSEKAVRIGRAPGNDVEVKSRGVSQYHAELRLLQPEGTTEPQLYVRDLSMNGSGLKRSGSKQAPMHLQKRVDTHVASGDTILVPMMLKVSQESTDRAWLKIEYDGEVSKDDDKDDSDEKEAAKEKDDSEDEKAKGDDADIETNRMRFVELLLKTREVSSGTTYAQAKKLLGHSADWDAVDEATRKECFDIFVQHLGQQGADKKKKHKKGKDKDKTQGKEKKSKKNKDDSVATPEPKVTEKARRKSSPSRADSSDRKRKRDRKQRSRSRPARSASGDRAKRRRRSP